MVKHIFIAGSWIRNMFQRLGNGTIYECVSCCAAFCCIGDDLNDERTGGAWFILGFNSVAFANIFLVVFLIIQNVKYIDLIGLIVGVESMFNFVGLVLIHQSGPYIQRSEVSNKKPIGRFNKFLIDAIASCIVILLQYSFECVWQCIVWILFVVEFQVILKLRYGPRDLIFSDVLVGAIMRLLVVYHKENEVNRLIVIKFVLCVLIIYHMHRSFITTATAISRKTQEGSEIKDIQAVIAIETNS